MEFDVPSNKPLYHTLANHDISPETEKLRIFWQEDDWLVFLDQLGQS